MSRKIKDLDLTANPLTHQQSTIDTIAYPSVRYFQIHFEYLHEELRRSVKLMETLHQQVRQLEQRLSSSQGLNNQSSAQETTDAINAHLSENIRQIKLNNTSLQLETENSGPQSVTVNFWQN